MVRPRRGRVAPMVGREQQAVPRTNPGEDIGEHRIELLQGVTGSQSGVAHFAHLGGMVGSALVIMQWRYAPRKRLG